MNYSLFNELEKPLIIIDKKGIIQYVNLHTKNILKFDITTLKGEHFTKIMSDRNLIDTINKYLAENSKADASNNDINIISGDSKTVLNVSPLVYGESFSVMLQSYNPKSDEHFKGFYKELYEFLINNLDVAITIADTRDNGKSFRIKETHSRFEANGQYVCSNLKDKNITEIFPSCKHYDIEEITRKVWCTGISAKVPVFAHKKKDNIKWGTNHIFKADNGDIIFIYNDKTEQLKNRKKYHALNKKFKMFLDNFPGYAYVKNINGDILYANKKFKTDINLDPNDNNLYSHKFKIKDLHKFKEQDIKVLNQNESECFEDFIKGYYFLTTKFPLNFSSNEKILGGISVDITQMRKNEIQLNKLNEFKNVLLSIIGHDLKNPINVQMGFLELLLDDYDSIDDTQKKDYLKIISESVKSSHQILNNLLEWSKTNLNDVKFFPDNINIKDTLNRIIHQHEANIRVKKLHIVTDIPDNGEVYADENMLEIILRNIFANAVKFSQTNGTISIYTKESNSHIKISIEDNGIGMSKYIRENLFKINTDKIREGTKGEKGTGLGLFLCREFIKMHKGDIKVESQINKGSIFHICFPKKLIINPN